MAKLTVFETGVIPVLAQIPGIIILIALRLLGLPDNNRVGFAVYLASVLITLPLLFFLWWRYTVPLLNRKYPEPTDIEQSKPSK
jgi:hypothetical protein